jgi:NAD(P) transhydrogenase
VIRDSTIPSEQTFDLVIIGSGPAGEGAAMKAAKDGASVAVIERAREVGGGCVHWATIPSKALRHSVGQFLDLKKSPLFSTLAAQLKPGFPQLLRAAEGVIARQVSMRRDFYERNHVEVIRGHATFAGQGAAVGSETPPVDLEVKTLAGPRRVRGKNVLVAVGSRPYRPTPEQLPGIDFAHPRIVDSDTVLKLGHTPDSITIYGAGVVGCEYASIFRNLGVKVNLVNGRDKLLSFLDDEIIDALAYHLRDQGVVIRHNEGAERVEAKDDLVVLHLKSGKKIGSEVLLWANGRSGNTHDLGLPNVGLAADARGLIAVDETFRTKVENIYAAGDVIGLPSLASASYDQGRFAAAAAIHGSADWQLVKNVPTGIYTSPEISSVGRTERELTAEGIPYEVGHSLFRSLARAQITGNTVGMLKILFHRETLAILGIHCFGDQAAEIVHIGQAIMSQAGSANTVMYFVNTTFNYPTMAEAYRVAALNGINRLV